MIMSPSNNGIFRLLLIAKPPLHLHGVMSSGQWCVVPLPVLRVLWRWWIAEPLPVPLGVRGDNHHGGHDAGRQSGHDASQHPHEVLYV